jgi:hypothetical protein
LPTRELAWPARVREGKTVRAARRRGEANIALACQNLGAVEVERDESERDQEWRKGGKEVAVSETEGLKRGGRRLVVVKGVNKSLLDFLCRLVFRTFFISSRQIIVHRSIEKGSL